MLKKVDITDFVLENDKRKSHIQLFYQVFGQPIGDDPIVLVNHALTGNSNVSGEKGWWKNVIDYDHIIDLNKYTVIAFNIPGNDFERKNELALDYKEVSTLDIAKLFWLGLEKIKIKSLFALIGGSLGGGISWEMAVLHPNRVQKLIPIATHYFASDWVIANVGIQDDILNQSQNPVAVARKHAMLLYRTPQSINQRFKNAKEGNIYTVNDWLSYHGILLTDRFSLNAYKQMNYLLGTINVVKNDFNLNAFLKKAKLEVYAININSDLLFQNDLEEYEILQEDNENFKHYIIDSIHGHDAFLMEYQQLNDILKQIF
ncbi:alpha/beta fold hydrolase [Flavobacterium jejuense]|uniref:Alpha/beta fold hydrolase n=1 Tax=Flavobacterium jejuense TaxID=1544455 RepID=A0ABX0J133_9FLAO|nr:alpha/beta fold hydrolase [Flavobacterium jejuense]NHN27645.1 alpha/beta fold hydrolase [Flavobacterium jejuense]